MATAISQRNDDTGKKTEADTKPEITELSTQYDTPMGLAHTTMQALKDRIKVHYDLASDYYLNLWGEHIHHGYWPPASSSPTATAAVTKEEAQVNLINLLLKSADLPSNSSSTSSSSSGSGSDSARTHILDVGCGVGGTSRYLASTYGAEVTGITISGKQIEIAERLTRSARAAESAVATAPAANPTGASTTARAATETNGEDKTTTTTTKQKQKQKRSGILPLGQAGGNVQFIELDAEKMGEYFAKTNEGKSAEKGEFDVVWISEALSHFPNKPLFFRNAAQVLSGGTKNLSSSGGGTVGENGTVNAKAKAKAKKLVIADWFKAEELGQKEFDANIKPIEDGMLLPPLCTQNDYVRMAKAAGFKVFSEPNDISECVSKTWDISWSLVQNPSLWAFAFSQGRDGIAFLQAFRAMRRGYADGSFRYAVMVFEKE